MRINRLVRGAFRYLSDPCYRFLFRASRGKYNAMPDREFLSAMYKAIFGQEINWETPTGFNEKLQWLKLYNRRPEYTMMVDKYLVRDYIAQVLGEEFLIPLLGVWDDPDEIDFDALPDQFVLKCNHNSGLGMCICKDKSKLDIPKVKAELRKGLKQDYYLTGREWPYKDVPRKIICEKFMSDGSKEDLKDYKFYCFNGKAKMLGIYSDRNKPFPTKADYFYEKFQWLDLTWGYPHAEVTPGRPEEFLQMMEIAEKLAQKLPSIRVDLYLCGKRIYFGELTFFDGSGFDHIEPMEWDYKLGEYCVLPKKSDKLEILEKR